MKYKIILTLGLVLIVTACTPKETATPEPTPGDDPIDIRCPINYLETDSLITNIPRVYADGECAFRFLPSNDNTLTGVFIIYPSGWAVSVVNETGTALLFELEPRLVYLEAFLTDISLDQLDQSVLSTDVITTEPIILADETIKEEILTTIGEKEVFVLTTTLSEQTIRRYFINGLAEGKESTLYMLQLTVSAPEVDNSQLIDFVENIILNMDFDN